MNAQPFVPWTRRFGCSAWMALWPAILVVGNASAQAGEPVRFATYNVSLYGKQSGQVLERLADGRDRQAERIATVIQTVRPDVLLVNEIDYDDQAALARLLAEKFFAIAQGDLQPIDYPHVVAFPSNTGIDSGLDLNRNGRQNEPNDAWGYGAYPGQYAMAIFSRFPIDPQSIRTFQKFLWKDFPAAERPVDPRSGKPYYDDEIWPRLRLSSKNHVDVPVKINGQTVHVLASHPTPPVFDGPEDRNGARNHDEIRFWSYYIGTDQAMDLVDDRGNQGGLPGNAPFVIMGDLNADPVDGDARRRAIVNLLDDPRLVDTRPQSEGGAEAASNLRRKVEGDAGRHTSGFGLRIDYVLPSRNLSPTASGVHWPRKDQPGSDAVRGSDHRLVWVDVVVREKPER